MNARDVIAEAMCRPAFNKLDAVEYAIDMLRRAGFTIIRDDETHAPTERRTLKRAERECSEIAGNTADFDQRQRRGAGACVAAIRALIKEGGEDE